MRTLIFIERIGSAVQRFIQTKGFLVMLTFAIIMTSAAILAFLINQAIAPRLVSFFDVAFGLSAKIANRFSFGLALGISVLAYIVLAARGMNTTIGTIRKVENGKIIEKLAEVGKRDTWYLGITLLAIEIVAILVLYQNGKGDAEIIGGIVMLQVLIGVLLKTALPMVQYAQDTASKNIESETELAHKLASEKAQAALNPTAAATKPLLGKIPNTDLSIRKSKIA